MRLPRVALVAFGALAACALGTLSGCKKEETAKPEPAATDTAAQTARIQPHHPGRGAFNRPDPAVTKEYRVDVCYYGTLSLRQARDAYLASLGKDEPSAKKIPSFGAPAAPAGSPGTPGAPGTPPGAGAPGAPGTPGAPGSPVAKPSTPPAPPTPPARPGASAAPVAPNGSAAAPPPPDRSREVIARMPHERNARSCASAVPIKDAPMGDVDTQLAAYAPFAVELAKDITLAQQYYLREEYTKDSFAKGKELDKKLRESFAKLDDMSNKLGAALEAWRKDHPASPPKGDDGEKVVRDVIDDARNVLLAVAQKKVDAEGWKTLLDKLDKSSAALKTFADAHPADNWSKIMTVPVDMFTKTAKGAKPTPDKGVDSDSYLGLVTGFTTLLDSKQRAIARSARPMPTPAEAPNAPAPNAPAPNAPPPAQQ